MKRVGVKLFGKYFDLDAAEKYRDSVLATISFKKLYQRSNEERAKVQPQLIFNSLSDIFALIAETRDKRIPELQRAEKNLNRQIERLNKFLFAVNIESTDKITRTLSLIRYYQRIHDAIVAVEQKYLDDVKEAEIIDDELQQKAFAARLKILRGEKSIRAAAKEMMISFSDLSQYELGRATPSFRNLIKIIRYYGVSADFLLFGKN